MVGQAFFRICALRLFILKRNETFGDRVAAFIIGAIVGCLIAWALMTFERVNSKEPLLGVIAGSGLFAAFAWGPFWRIVAAFFNLER